jgi:hypothetical protein
MEFKERNNITLLLASVPRDTWPSNPDEYR